MAAVDTKESRLEDARGGVRRMAVHLGTSGFSYPEWRGTFYPEDLPENRMLAFYGERLSSVEINNSFYRMPSAKVLSTWAAEVPERFRFVLKASRRDRKSVV